MTTVFEALRASHREVDELLRAVHDVIGTGRLELARTLFRRVAIKLIATTRAKAAVVYPRLAREAHLVEEVEQALLEHGDIERMIDVLRVGRLDDAEWCAALERLAKIVTDHADREECTLFPMARLALTTEATHEIAIDYLSRVRHAAPIAGASITYDLPDPDPPRMMIVSVKAA